MFNPCCCNCELASDDFDRSDNTDIDAGSPFGWDEVAGDGAIVSSELKFSATNSRVISSVSHSDAYITISSQVFPNSTTTKPWVIFGWVDASNYFAIEIGATSGGATPINLIQNGSVIYTWSAQFSRVTGNVFIVWVSVTPSGQLTWNLDVNDSGNHFTHSGFFDFTSSTTGAAGLGTGSVVSTACSFQSFTLEAPNIGTGCVFRSGLTTCNHGLAYPNHCGVTLAGITDTGCGSAALLNDTFELDFVWSQTSSGNLAPRSFYRVNFPSAICSVDGIAVLITHTSAVFPGTPSLFQVSTFGSGRSITWRTSTGMSGCHVVSGTIPFLSQTAGSGHDGSASTASVLFY